MRNCIVAGSGIVGLLVLIAHAMGDAPNSPRIGKLPAGKVLFLGNSITLHGPAPNIGWTGTWGMAATEADRDYVHRVTQSITKATGKRPAIKVSNVADFERRYADFDVAKSLQSQLEFAADIVIIAVGENVPHLKDDGERTRFAEAFGSLLAAFRSKGSPAIFVRGSFWPDPAKDGIMKKACEKIGGTWVEIGHLAKDETNYARTERKIDHAGVAAHPGDQGMERIADAIWSAIEKRAK
ncbi:MAG: SGNH/GDSL hydrolase family protein [Gemmataceae bacterium]